MSNVTGEQVRDAMMAGDIDRVPHHDCSICGEWTFYARQNDQLFYSSACGCAWSEPRWRDWGDAAEWINMQSAPEWKEKLAAKFGLTPNVI